MISVIDSATGTATPDEMEAIDAFNDTLVAENHWVLAGGLANPSAAWVIDARTSETSISQGPLVESDLFVSGFWVIDAPSLEVARGLATEASKSCNRVVELRPFLGG